MFLSFAIHTCIAIFPARVHIKTAASKGIRGDGFLASRFSGLTPLLRKEAARTPRSQAIIVGKQILILFISAVSGSAVALQAITVAFFP